jgi:ribose transport system ATP-binding protein
VAPQPASGERALKARALSVWPNGRSFDFDLRHGEIVGIAGLDGQGQDAFVRVLAGVQPALSGQVQVADRAGDWQPVRNLHEATAGKITYVSGDRKREGIFASLSIFENMVFPLYRERKRAGILSLIDFESLIATFKREVGNLMIKFGAKEDRITSLSGGNQQKVLIGRGFAMRPDVIVLNDPARGIDVGAKAELYKHLRAFAEQGKAVVYLSSEIEEFLGFATRVIVFRDGVPFDSFDGRSLEPKRVLEAMFGQTDGSGLTQSFGLVPKRALTAAAAGNGAGLHDGVRVRVEVPAEIKQAMRSASDYPARQRAREHFVSPEPVKVPLAPRSIRIVEFDADGHRKGEGAI